MLTMLPEMVGFEVVEVEKDSGQYVVRAKSAEKEAACPKCVELSGKVHSWYERKPEDLRSVGIAVELRLEVRRFFCGNGDCQRRVFCERLPNLVGVYARQTNRLVGALVDVGIELAGSAGVRLATKLKLPTSRDSLLRLIRRQPDPVQPEAVAIGIDDWAYRKHQRYGTLICDLETGCVLDLLDDRQPETVAKWLEERPTVQFVTRDRSQGYAAGIASGAPKATQIADRWHLAHNLVEALELSLAKHPKVLKGAEKEQAVEESQSQVAPDTEKQTLQADRVAASVASRSRRMEKYDRFIELRQQGVAVDIAAQQAGIAYSTAYRWLAHDSFPERQPNAKRKRKIDPYTAHIDRRWHEGCHKSKWLFYEIRAIGYDGSYVAVSRYCAETFSWGEERVVSTESTQHASKRLSPSVLPPARRSYSARQAAFLLIQSDDKLSDEQQADLEAILAEDSQFQTWRTLALRFMSLLRQRDSQALNAWLDDVAQQGSTPLQRFAVGLRRDYAEVLAAFTYHYSNGAAEGHINKLKFLKRQMFGRAKLDLLRKRLLHLS